MNDVALEQDAELLRAEIAETVASPEAVDGEMRFLAAALTPKRQ